MISLVVAYAKNRVIGKNSAIPWDIPGDRFYFKSLTIGSAVIMGRKTFESIGSPLPERLNIVLTRGNDSLLHKDDSTAPLIFSPSLEKAIEIAKENGYEKIFIIGGETVYREALEKHIPETLYISEIEGDFEGDAYFPLIDEKEWTLSESERVQNENEIPWIKKVYTTI